MIKIDNLKLNKNNKDILEKYQIYLLTVKTKRRKNNSIIIYRRYL